MTGLTYAGPGKGADVASWRQAARAEHARTMEGVHYAAIFLDLVKAFERVPHDHLVRFAKKSGYPLVLLRLGMAAYRLLRRVGVDGVYSREVVATRGITAGSVFATVELRVIMLEIFDDIVKLSRAVIPSV